MESREYYRKRLVAIEWKLLDMRQALEEARQLSDELAETQSTRLAVHDLSEAVLPGLNSAIDHLRRDLESM
jgi:hypothetical protein